MLSSWPPGIVARFGCWIMNDTSERVKAKILAWLESDTSVTSLVPASSIFPMQVAANQTKPFLRYGRPTVTPFEDFCGQGVQVEVTIHCFTVGESLAQRVSAAVEASLRRMDNILDYQWVRTQFMSDPDEASIWNGMVTVTVTDRS